jgi:hypothetical protein
LRGREKKKGGKGVERKEKGPEGREEVGGREESGKGGIPA